MLEATPQNPSLMEAGDRLLPVLGRFPDLDQVSFSGQNPTLAGPSHADESSKPTTESEKANLPSGRWISPRMSARVLGGTGLFLFLAAIVPKLFNPGEKPQAASDLSRATPAVKVETKNTSPPPLVQIADRRPAPSPSALPEKTALPPPIGSVTAVPAKAEERPIVQSALPALLPAKTEAAAPLRLGEDYVLWPRPETDGHGTPAPSRSPVEEASVPWPRTADARGSATPRSTGPAPSPEGRNPPAVPAEPSRPAPAAPPEGRIQNPYLDQPPSGSPEVPGLSYPATDAGIKRP